MLAPVLRQRLADRARGHAMIQAALEDFKLLEMVLHAQLAEQFLRADAEGSTMTA